MSHRIPLEAYRPTIVRSLVVVPFGEPGPFGAVGAYWASLHAATAAEVELLEELATAASAAIVRVGLDDARSYPRRSSRPRHAGNGNGRRTSCDRSS